VIEYLQSAFIRKPEDIEKALNLTVLGTIPTIRGKDVQPKAKPALKPQTSSAERGA